MRSLAVAAALLLGVGQAAPAPFPWTRGWLDAGTSFDRPLRFTWDQREFSVPAGGWEKRSLEVGLDVLWSAAPVSSPRAGLTPGRPEGQWTVPIMVKTNLKAPAVVALSSGAGLRASFPLAVNPSVPAPRAPAPGQEYLRVGGSVVYRYQGEIPDYPVLTGRVLTLRRLEATRAVFWADGLGEVVREGRPQAGFSDLAPLVSDPDLATLKRKYEGKTVWAYGGLGGFCQPSPGEANGVGTSFHEPLKVRRVLRLARPLVLNAGSGFGDEVGRGADSVALTPLVFLLDGHPFISDGSFSVVGAAAEAPLRETDPDNTLGCGRAFPAYLPDTWAVERVFSLTPPSKAVPEEAPADPRGLTRWQYAWLVGFPSSTFGTRDKLLKKSEWQYRNIPFPATVTFDVSGKVQDIEIPRLP